MNKKTRNVLILILLAVACLFIFASCSRTKADVFKYSEDDLGAMGKLVRWMHSWVGNYGWTVVVFTVFLKIIMLPLDFWQRYSARKSALKMQRMQPIIEGIDKRYGANTQRANEEKQKLYKKQGFSALSSCLPMIVSMAIFFTMFGGLTNYATYNSIHNFKELSNTYYESYAEKLLDEQGEHYSAELKEVYDQAYKTAHDSAINVSKDDEEIADLKGKIAAIGAVQNHNPDACEPFMEYAVTKVQEKYEERREGWLWIKNIWQPDTWASVMQKYNGGLFDGGSFYGSVSIDDHPDKTKGEYTYKVISDAVLQMENAGHGANGSWNGLMILPFLSIGLSFLSMFISQQMEKKNRKGEAVQQNAQQATTGKVMMIMMPLMMAFFGFSYTGAFAIYMVVNYSLSILTTVALRWPVEKVVTRKLDKDDQKNKTGKATYMR